MQLPQKRRTSRQNKEKSSAAKQFTEKVILVPIDQKRISTEFSFVLTNGKEVFPVQVKRRKTGVVAFRISPGGSGGNTIAAGEEVDEETMVHRVLKEGFAVRCKSLDGSTTGLYKHGHRSVREVRKHA
jgi:hypothetical protein